MAAATVAKRRHGRRLKRDAPEPAEDLVPNAEHTLREGELDKRVLTTIGTTIWQLLALGNAHSIMTTPLQGPAAARTAEGAALTGNQHTAQTFR